MSALAAVSSFLIVPWPWLSEIVAFVGLVRLTKKVSSVSLTVSPLIVTGTDLVVSPGLNVSVPLVEL
jgi:hypothetical protein